MSNVTLRLLAVSLATLAGCGSNKPAPAPLPVTEPPAPTTAPTAPPTAAVDPSRPKPEIGAWGFDEAGMDKSVAPGQSFFRYADGTWLKTTPIPADKAEYGMFSVLSDRSDERTKEILEAATGAPGSDGQRIGDYYKTFMDEAAIEAKGTAPIQPELDRIAKIKDTNGVVLQLAAASHRLSNTAFRVRISQDERAPETYITTISQGGLGLPDRDMYEAKAKQFGKLRDGYLQYATQMFTMIGAKDADKRAAAVYALEEKIAATHWTRVQNRDPQKTYNKMTIAELQKLAPGIDWKIWLKAVGVAGQTSVVVSQPPAIAATSQLVKSEPLAVWKDYLTLHAVTDAAPFLSKQFVDVHFEMFGKTVTGTPQIKDRWKRGVEDITRKIGEAVGTIYVAKYFTPETKAHADAAGQEPAGLDGPADRRPRVDERADKGQGQGQARDIQPEDRLSQAVARLLRADDHAG